MRNWIIRFASLYVFNVVVLLVIGLLLPAVRVGWAALWAAIVLTVATLWIKPVVSRLVNSVADRRGAGRSREKIVEYLLAFVVAFAVWLIVALFSGVNVGGWFWGYLLPPIALMIAWAVYDVIDDRLERTAGDLYDRATAGKRTSTESAQTPSPSPQQRAATAAGEQELNDGLTAEQRRMLNDLD